jgi:hypothetical protein
VDILVFLAITKEESLAHVPAKNLHSVNHPSALQQPDIVNRSLGNLSG